MWRPTAVILVTCAVAACGASEEERQLALELAANRVCLYMEEGFTEDASLLRAMDDEVEAESLNYEDTEAVQRVFESFPCSGSTAAPSPDTNRFASLTPKELAETELELAQEGGSCATLTEWYEAWPGDSNPDIARHYQRVCKKTPPPVQTGELEADASVQTPFPQCLVRVVAPIRAGGEVRFIIELSESPTVATHISLRRHGAGPVTSLADTIVGLDLLTVQTGNEVAVPIPVDAAAGDEVKIEVVHPNSAEGYECTQVGSTFVQ